MRHRDGTMTIAEVNALQVVDAAEPDGAMLAKETSIERLQVASPVAKRLARAGVLQIDAGASAHLTELGKELLAR